MLIEKLLEANSDPSDTAYGIFNEDVVVELKACIRCVKALTHDPAVKALAMREAIAAAVTATQWHEQARFNADFGEEPEKC